MPVRGAKLKPAGQAVTRHKPVHDWTEVENIRFQGAPPLPEVRSNGEPWPARTLQKWAAWSTMPHAKLWSPEDWDFAVDALELAAEFHSGAYRLATELRNRERVLGTTMDFRRDLRIRYVDAAPERPEPASVTSMDDYRDL